MTDVGANARENGFSAFTSGFPVFAVALPAIAALLALQIFSLKSSDPLAAYAIFMLAAYSAAGVWAARRSESASRAESDNLVLVFIIAFGVRLLLAFFSYAGSEEAFFPDSRGYIEWGRMVAKLWAQGIKPDYVGIAQSSHYGILIYFGLHFFFHPSRLLPMITDCFLGAYVAVLTHRIAGHFYSGRRNARLRLTAAALIAFFPCAIFYATTNLKEALGTYLFIFSIELMLRLSRRFNLMSAVKILLCLVALSTIRFYLVFFIIFAGILMILAASTGRKNAFTLKFAMVLGVIVCIYSTPQIRNIFQSFFNLTSVMSITENVIESSTGDTDIKFSASAALSPGMLAQVLPAGFLRTFLSPLPTKATDGYEPLQPGMALYYLALPFIFAGFFHFVRKHFKEGMPVHVVFLLCVLFYTISVGASIRRAMIIWPLMAVFGAVGLGEFREFRRNLPTVSLIIFLLYCFFCIYIFGNYYGVELLKPLILVFGVFIAWVLFFALRRIPANPPQKPSGAET